MAASMVVAGMVSNQANTVLEQTIERVRRWIKRKYCIRVTNPEFHQLVLQYIHNLGLGDRRVLNLDHGLRTCMPDHNVYEIPYQGQTIYVRYRADKFTIAMYQHKFVEYLKRLFPYEINSFIATYFGGETDAAVLRKKYKEVNYTGILDSFVAQFKIQAELISDASQVNEVQTRVKYYKPNANNEWAYSVNPEVIFQHDNISAKGHVFLKDVEKFITSPPPNRIKKYMLHGAMGCGKTTMARILAHKYDMVIYYLQIDATMEGKIFTHLMHTAGAQRRSNQNNFIVVIDEFDKCIDNMQRGRYEKLNLDDLLAGLDGQIPLEQGAIVIMTANDISFLQDDKYKALNRAGRIDVCIHFDQPVASTAPTML